MYALLESKDNDFLTTRFVMSGDRYLLRKVMECRYLNEVARRDVMQERSSLEEDVAAVFDPFGRGKSWKILEV